MHDGTFKALGLLIGFCALAILLLGGLSSLYTSIFGSNVPAHVEQNEHQPHPKTIPTIAAHK